MGALLAATAVGGLLVAAPAKAFLGFGEDGTADYEKETANVLTNVRTVIDMPKEAEGKEDTVKELRKEINVWVAKYRRDPKFSGRPSYGNTYSVLNALAGHFNSFGPTANIPKKRLDRIRKEVDDAERLLSRGR